MESLDEMQKLAMTILRSIEDDVKEITASKDYAENKLDTIQKILVGGEK